MAVTNQPYIGFEGPIGAGKTTLAQLLALHLGATLVLEDVDGNAFLPDFYADRDRWALGTQLAFLISRYEQLRTIPPSRTRPVISDYTQAKDPIFARALLHDREVELYERLTVGLDASVPRPDVTVYVDARNDIFWIESGDAIGPTRRRSMRNTWTPCAVPTPAITTPLEGCRS